MNRRPDILELLGYAELEDRASDLEAERDAYRETLTACLDALRRVTRERDDLRALIDHWTQTSARRRPRRR